MLITFDLWDIIIQTDPTFKSKCNEALKAIIAPKIDQNEFNLVFETANTHLDQLSISKNKYYGFDKRMENVLERLGNPYPLQEDLEEARTALQAVFWQNPPRVFDKAVVEALRDFNNDGHRVDVIAQAGLISKNMYRDIINHLELDKYITDIHFHDEYDGGTIFGSALIQSGCDTGMHIGTNLSDKFKVKDVGMNFINVNKETNPFPFKLTIKQLMITLKDPQFSSIITNKL